jgi:hypothetical protein
MSVILLGGGSSLNGADGGNIGPMPKFSINREDITTGDGTYINSKFVININGFAVPISQGDITTKGNTQETVQTLATQFISFNVNGDNRLEISPYGGMPNSIVFDDARLTSIELPEQNEESSGTQYIEYSFVFEAYDDASKSTNSDWGIEKVNPTYKLSSAEESWDLSPNDGQSVFKDSDIVSGDTYKTFTLTHTISAVGVKKSINDGTLDPDSGHAWSQAAEWVKERLSQTELNNGTPDLPITKDIMGNDREVTSYFHPFYMNKNGVNTVQDLKTEPYKARNKVRTINSNISGGSYSVTDTWIVSLTEAKATHEVDINIDNSIEQSNVTITANGTITGLTEKDVDDNSDDKYLNAVEEYAKFLSGGNILATKIGLAASEVYSGFTSASYKTGVLLPYALSHSETHNKTAGTISWNMSFSDEEVLVPGAASQNVQITFENDQDIDYEHDNVTVIGVVRNGPYLYDPNTTTEKKLKISVDLVMASNFRSSKPDGTQAYVLPEMIYYHHQPRITAKTESWNPKTGAYNMSIEYTYV